MFDFEIGGLLPWHGLQIASQFWDIQVPSQGMTPGAEQSSELHVSRGGVFRHLLDNMTPIGAFDRIGQACSMNYIDFLKIKIKITLFEMFQR